MLVLALAVPAWAQKPGTAKPPVDYCQATFSASQATICQGGSAVLTFGENPCEAVEQVSYRWAPNQDISATTGPRVVVSPLVTTTYTLTRTPTGGAPATFSVTIAVQASCCQQATARNIVELKSSYQLYNGSQGGQPLNDPFRLYPSGTTFHVAGPSLTLLGNSANDTFTMPAGSVLLMDANADVVLGLGGRLELNGSTITAACDQMWGGLYVQGNSDLLDLHSVPLGITTPGAGGLHNRIMHSQKDIVLADQGPEFQIGYTQFLHNYTALDITRTTAPVRPRPVPLNKVQACEFDSDPALMKAPYNASGTDTWVAQHYLRVAGDLRGQDGGGTPGAYIIDNNTFDHSLFDIVSDRTATPLTLSRCTFNNFYLAGIYYVPTSGVFTPVLGSGDALTLRNQPGTCTFSFRPFKDLPATTQLNAALRTYARFLRYGTTGIKAEGIRVNVGSATFQQNNPVYYASAAPNQQVGINAQDLSVVGTNFLDLQRGVAHDLLAGSGNSQATQNLFDGCGTGYELSSYGGSTTPANAGTVTLDCNTFRRVSARSLNTGQYFGLYLASGAFANLNVFSQSGQQRILKNKFENGSVGPGAFQAIYNANTGFQFGYFTYNDYGQTLVPYTNNFVDLLPAGVTYPNNGTDCVSGNGLLRQVVPTGKTILPNGKARLEQNAPNPTHGTTEVRYWVPNNVQVASLLVRRATDGKLVADSSLDMAAGRLLLSTKDYPSGTYFYTLVANGVPVATRRLVVE